MCNNLPNRQGTTTEQATADQHGTGTEARDRHTTTISTTGTQQEGTEDSETEDVDTEDVDAAVAITRTKGTADDTTG